MREKAQLIQARWRHRVRRIIQTQRRVKYLICIFLVCNRIHIQYEWRKSHLLPGLGIAYSPWETFPLGQVWPPFLSGRSRFHEAYSMPPLLTSLIKIIMKSEEEESKAPDDSKINQLKPMIRLTLILVQIDNLFNFNKDFFLQKRDHISRLSKLRSYR